MDGTIRTRSFTVDRHSYLRAMWTRGLPRRLAIVAAIYLGVCVFVVTTLGWSALAWAVPLLLAGFALSLGLRYGLIRRRIYDPMSNALYEDPRTMAFSVEGFHVSTQGGVESQVPWSRILRAEIRGEFLLLFMSRLQHFIVPNSAFVSTGDREAFWLLIRARGLVTGELPKPPDDE